MGNTDCGTVTVDPTKYFPDDFVFGARSFYDAGFYQFSPA